jgi:hypothetical protein
MRSSPPTAFALLWMASPASSGVDGHPRPARAGADATARAQIAAESAYPGKRYEDWELDDPAEADLDGVRRIRDDIAGRVRRLVDELAPGP